MAKLLIEQDQRYEKEEYAALQLVEQEYPWSRSLLEKLRHTSEWSYHASQRVGVMCYGMAHVLGLSEEKRLRLAASGLLHDMGKAKLAPHILDKPGKLTDEEVAVMQTHSRIGFEMIRPFDEEIAKRVVMVHEFQKTPYPRKNIRVDGDPEVVRDGRLVAIADSIDRLMSISPYKSSVMSIDEAVCEVQNVPLFGIDPILHTAAVIRSFL